MHTVLLLGQHGIGKTTLPEDLCREYNWAFSATPLGEIQEAGDLSGLPILSKDSSGNTITATARPDFLPDPNDKKPGIVLFDDFNRAMDHILQAFMRLSHKGEYRGWKMPRNQIIVLTGNDDDTKYNISSTDEAQLDRMYHLRLQFDVASWLRWANTITVAETATKGSKEKTGKVNTESHTMIDGRVIGIVTKTYAENKSMGNGFPWGTPRETERLSDAIFGLDDRKAVEMAGTLNPVFGQSLASYVSFRKDMPSISEILKMSNEEVVSTLRGKSRAQKMILMYEVCSACASRIASGTKVDMRLGELAGTMLANSEVPSDLVAGIMSMMDEGWAEILGCIPDNEANQIAGKTGTV